jgi:hypothetical protein
MNQAESLKLCDAAVKKGWLTVSQVLECQQAAAAEKRPLADILVARGFLTVAQVAQLTALSARIPSPKRPTQRPAPPPAAPPAPPSRKTLLLIAAGSGTLVLAIGVILLLVLGGKKTPKPPPEVRNPPAAPTPKEPTPPPDPVSRFDSMHRPQIERYMKAGEFAKALELLDAVESTSPEKAAQVRIELITEALKGFERLRREIGPMWSTDRTQARQLATDARPRFKGVENLDRELDKFVAELESMTSKGGAEEILEQADRLFAEAKALYQEGGESLNDAGFRAEEARIKYQAVQDVLTGDGQRRAAEQLKATIQLAKLINDARKQLAKPVIDKPPVIDPDRPVKDPPETPPVDPPPTRPKLDTKALEMCLGLMDRFVTADPTLRYAEARTILRGLIKASERDERLAASGALFARESPAEPERKAIGDYLSKVDWRGFDDMDPAAHEAALALLDSSRAQLRPAPSDGLMLLQMAHLNRLMKLNPESPKASSWAAKLGMTAQDVVHWATPAAAAMFQAKKFEDRPGEAVVDLKRVSSNDPAFSYFRAWFQTLEYLALPVEEKKKQSNEMMKLFRDLRPPEPQKKLCKAVSEIFKLLQPCKRCGGEKAIDCALCEEGQATYRCEQCGGKGGSDALRCSCGGSNDGCSYCGGKGFVVNNPCPACKARGVWKDKCTKCKGQGKVDCIQCKAPWSEPALENIVSSTPCGLCRETGFTFDRALSPCPDCHGVGKLLDETKKPLKPR